MKKLTQKELINFQFKQGRKNSSIKQRQVTDFLNQLEVGEICLITKEDWDVKTEPVMYVHVVFSKKNPKKSFSIRTLVDNTGWVITRKQDKE